MVHLPIRSQRLLHQTLLHCKDNTHRLWTGTFPVTPLPPKRPASRDLVELWRVHIHPLSSTFKEHTSLCDLQGLSRILDLHPVLDPLPRPTHKELEHRRYSRILIDDLLRGNNGAKKVRVPALEVNGSYGITCNAIPGRVSWGSGERDDIPVVHIVVCAQGKGSR